MIEYQFISAILKVKLAGNQVLVQAGEKSSEVSTTDVRYRPKKIMNIIERSLEENKEREVSLLYIAMTRAKNYLAVSYSRESEFTQYFEEIKRIREIENEERATK